MDRLPMWQGHREEMLCQRVRQIFSIIKFLALFKEFVYNQRANGWVAQLVRALR